MNGLVYVLIGIVIAVVLIAFFAHKNRQPPAILKFIFGILVTLAAVPVGFLYNFSANFNKTSPTMNLDDYLSVVIAVIMAGIGLTIMTRAARPKTK